MIIVVLLLCFSLNIVKHGNILIGILNTLLLFFSIYLYFRLSNQRLSFKSLKNLSPLFIFIAPIPLFIQNQDIYIILLAIGINLLILCYLATRFKKTLVLVISFYILFACFYANGIIKLPFSIQSDLLIFTDDRVNLYISQMQKEALYMPYRLRLLLFNSSVYIYVILSKLAGIFTFKNLYDGLLMVNLYPMIKCVVLDFNNWNKSKILIIYCILMISLFTVSSRTVDIFKTFTLLLPILMYFILKGLGYVNKAIYIVLFVISIVIATSPLR